MVLAPGVTSLVLGAASLLCLTLTSWGHVLAPDSNELIAAKSDLAETLDTLQNHEDNDVAKRDRIS